MRINQNIAAFNAYRNLNQTQSQLTGSLEKLSSGFRINRAADDASGLVNSENLRSQIGGLRVATRNAQDAISLVQTAEGAQTEVHSLLQRMRDLAVQSGNLGTNDQVALQANQDEIEQLVAELDRIADQTQFGTQKILDGRFSGTGGDPVDLITQADGSIDAGTDDVVELNVADLWDAVGTQLDAEEIGDYSGRVSLTFGHDGAEFSVEVARNASASDIAQAVNNELARLHEEDGLAGWDDFSVSVDLTDGLVTIEGPTATEAFTVDVATAPGEGAVFQVGANAGQVVNVSINEVSATSLNVDAIDVLTEAGVNDAIAAIDDAISSVSANRAELGAFQNRMESTIRNLSVAVENLSAAESRIRDTDMALEMVEFTRSQILSQAGTAMLAQANLVPQSVLALLQ